MANEKLSQALKGNKNAAKDYQGSQEDKNKPEYRYSVGGYFATKQTQKILDRRAEAAKELLPKARLDLKSAEQDVSSLNKQIKSYESAIETFNKIEAESNAKIKEALNIGKSIADTKPPKLSIARVRDNLGMDQQRQFEINRLALTKSLSNTFDDAVEQRRVANSMAAQNRNYNYEAKAALLKRNSALEEARDAVNSSESYINKAKTYKPVSDNYLNNYAKQTKQDVKKTIDSAKSSADAMRKRMWGR